MTWDQPLREYAATFTFDEDDNLYYFKITGAQSARLVQRPAKATLDLDEEGNLVGVELIDDMPRPSTGGRQRRRFFHWRTGYIQRRRRPYHPP